jgi:hypothetical protein
MRSDMFAAAGKQSFSSMETSMMPLNPDRQPEDELAQSQLRVARLEVLICDLLSRNEHLRMALRSMSEEGGGARRSSRKTLNRTSVGGLALD